MRKPFWIDKLANMVMGLGSDGLPGPDVVGSEDGADTAPTTEDDTMTYTESAINAWAEFFQEVNERKPLPGERQEQELVINYAYEEALSVSDALDYMASELLECDTEDVPPVIKQLMGLSIMEYLNGNLKAIQGLGTEEDED